MLDNLLEKLNDILPSTDKAGRTREFTERYFIISIPHIILLLLALPLIPIMLSFGDDAAGFIMATAFAVIVPWAVNMMETKYHRTDMEEHRDYMNSW